MKYHGSHSPSTRTTPQLHTNEILLSTSLSLSTLSSLNVAMNKLLDLIVEYQ